MVRKLLFITVFASAGAMAQSAYTSLGFNFSLVSGVGISYRTHAPGKSLFQLTGAVFNTGGDTFYSFGAEYQYELSEAETFRFFIPVGSGIYSGGKLNAVAGAGLGVEVPMLGEKIFQGVTVGGELYYPAFFFGDDTKVTFAASVFLFYNF